MTKDSESSLQVSSCATSDGETNKNRVVRAIPAWVQRGAFFLVVLLILVAAYMDVRPYWQAVKEFGEHTEIDLVQKEIDQIDREFNLLGECGAPHLSDKTAQQIADSRDCLLRSIPQVETFAGAVYSAALASALLHHNPKDDELKRLALSVIESGWVAYWKRLPTYEKLDRLAMAHDQSVLLRIRDGSWHHPGHSTSLLDAEMLEDAEWEIRMPEVIRAHKERRLKISNALASL